MILVGCRASKRPQKKSESFQSSSPAHKQVAHVSRNESERYGARGSVYEFGHRLRETDQRLVHGEAINAAYEHNCRAKLKLKLMYPRTFKAEQTQKGQEGRDTPTELEFPLGSTVCLSGPEVRSLLVPLSVCLALRCRVESDSEKFNTDCHSV